MDFAYTPEQEALRRDVRQFIAENVTDDAALDRAIGLMKRHGAIADTIARARHFGDIARDALAPLKSTPQKAALIDVIDFCISRVS